jgi:hypothetical protein
MDNFIDQLLEALIWTEEKAESIAKLAKLFKKGADTYSEISSIQLGNSAALTMLGKSAPDSNEGDLILQMAKLWSHLPKDTRRDLIDPFLAETSAGGNEAIFVRGLFNQLALLASMTHPVAHLGVMVGKVLKNQENILKELETINGRLKAIEISLDERVLTDARAAIKHLTDAANVKNQSVRDQNLQLATSIFTKLTAVDPNQTTQGTSGTMQNKALIALGYWGRHLILGMQDETHYALVQVYECTQSYPLEGMMVFPPAYFSKDYKSEIDEASLGENMALSQWESAQKGNRQTQIVRGLEMAGGLVLSVAGLAALFAGNSSMIQAGLTSLRGGTNIYTNANNKPTTPYDSITPFRTALSLKETRERLAMEITAECSARLQFLGRIEVADLRKIILPLESMM